MEPCPICGRDDGGHDPTPAERRLLRRVKWRAFVWGLLHPFG